MPLLATPLSVSPNKKKYGPLFLCCSKGEIFSQCCRAGGKSPYCSEGTLLKPVNTTTQPPPPRLQTLFAPNEPKGQISLTMRERETMVSSMNTVVQLYHFAKPTANSKNCGLFLLVGQLLPYNSKIVYKQTNSLDTSTYKQRFSQASSVTWICKYYFNTEIQYTETDLTSLCLICEQKPFTTDKLSERDSVSNSWPIYTTQRLNNWSPPNAAFWRRSKKNL